MANAARLLPNTEVADDIRQILPYPHPPSALATVADMYPYLHPPIESMADRHPSDIWRICIRICIRQSKVWRIGYPSPIRQSANPPIRQSANPPIRQSAYSPDFHNSVDTTETIGVFRINGRQAMTV
ncbi:hypothetical protein V1506DRAFT_521446 [Lipomyces tetrasporus]